jgi:NADPH:quinone reductase-like Zn-dependent oxidoreductase
VAAGRLRPAIERGFALDEAPAALDYLAGGGQRGKLVLRIGGSVSS